ncbi:MAG: hypothetical protein ACTHKT_01695, partial [Solirubrobacterales bacterium]
MNSFDARRQFAEQVREGQGRRVCFEDVDQDRALVALVFGGGRGAGMARGFRLVLHQDLPYWCHAAGCSRSAG